MGRRVIRRRRPAGNSRLPVKVNGGDTTTLPKQEPQNVTLTTEKEAPRVPPLRLDDITEGDGPSLTLKSVASTFLTSEAQRSARGSDSGIASDCSFSVCSEEEEHDVTQHSHDVSRDSGEIMEEINDVAQDSGDVTRGSTLNFNDVVWKMPIYDMGDEELRRHASEDADDVVDFREDDDDTYTCRAEEEDGSPAAAERPATPVTSARRNAVSLTSADLGHIVEDPGSDGDESEADSGDESEADDDDESIKSEVISEGGWVNSDNSDTESESSGSGSENEAGETENDCERYCRDYQSHRFQVFGNVDDVTGDDVTRCKSPADDYCLDEFVSGGKPSASDGYRFPRCQPDDIDDVISFWEVDFQVGAYNVSRMSAWERLEMAPSRVQEPKDHRRYLVYKTLYARWVACNRSHEQWNRRYWSKSLTQVLRTGRPTVRKLYPAQCTDIPGHTPPGGATRPQTLTGGAKRSLTQAEIDAHTRSVTSPDANVRPSCSRSVSQDSDVTAGCPLGFYDVMAV